MMAVKGINRSVHQTGKLCFTELLVDNQPVFAGSDYLEEDISIARKLRIHESDKSFTLFSQRSIMAARHRACTFIA